MAFHTDAYALLVIGQRVGAELPCEDAALRSWVVVTPFIKGKKRFGPEGDRRYTGTGDPSFSIVRFSARKSSIEAGYDLAGELIGEQRIEIVARGDIDRTLVAVEDALAKQGIDAASLGALGDDYPL